MTLTMRNKGRFLIKLIAFRKARDFEVHSSVKMNHLSGQRWIFVEKKLSQKKLEQGRPAETNDCCNCSREQRELDY